MAGIQVEVQFTGLVQIRERLDRIGRTALPAALKSIGAEVGSQTRRRLSEEKHGPDGQAWKPWTPEYAATRTHGQSLLERSGRLIDSITFRVDSGEVAVGSGLPYAAIHQFGGAEVGMNIPARPYLGLSSENEEDLVAVALDVFDRELRGRQRPDTELSA